MWATASVIMITIITDLIFRIAFTIKYLKQKGLGFSNKNFCQQKVLIRQQKTYIYEYSSGSFD